MASDSYERGWRSVEDLERPVVSEEAITREQAARRSRGRIRLMVRLLSLLVVLGGFSALVVYAYNWGTGGIEDGQVPIVRAEASPEKEAPVERGGLSVPYQESLVLNDAGQAQRVERIVPPPEEPLTLPRESVSSNVVEEPAAPLDQAEPQVATEEEDPIGSLIQMAELDNGVGTDAKEADGNQAGGKLPDQGPAAEQLAQVGQVSGFKVQLASLKNEEAARQEWARIQKAHKDLLGSLDLAVQRVDLQDRGVFYRIQGGPLPSRETAADLCGLLKGRDQPCIVVAP